MGPSEAQGPYSLAPILSGCRGGSGGGPYPLPAAGAARLGRDREEPERDRGLLRETL